MLRIAIAGTFAASLEQPLRAHLATPCDIVMSHGNRERPTQGVLFSPSAPMGSCSQPPAGGGAIPVSAWRNLARCARSQRQVFMSGPSNPSSRASAVMTEPPNFLPIPRYSCR